jgi:hypothetical protein
MNFHLKADMFVAYPKRQLAHYVDNTMPRRDWSRYDAPVKARGFRAPRYRTPISFGETATNLFLRRQAG